VKKVPSHPYACGELEHNFAPSTPSYVGGIPMLAQ
jgi:hypothetical protein